MRSATATATGSRSQSVGWLIASLALLFFFSGACALVYQGLWLRMLTHVFGVTTWAASTVLGVFMAGLALGSYAAGRLSDRVRSPLLWFGLAEMLVGLSALGSRFALDIAEDVYVWLAPSMPDSLGPLTLVRFLLTLIVLIVPTTLMGSTLPLVVRSTLFRDGDLGQRISLLYATNTAGAIGGTLLAGYVLIGGYGLDYSFKLAAATNLVIGLLAALLSLAVGPAQATSEDDEVTPAASSALLLSPTFQRAVLFVFACSGIASLALEVIWFRILTLFLESNTYAFTIMLATVLAGIAAGSALVTPMIRRAWHWPLILAVLELLIGISAVLSLTALNHTQDVIGLLSPLVASQGRAGVERLGPPVISFLALFPTTLLFGAAFPLGLKLWTNDSAGAGTGERIGTFYSLNVFGAIIGSVAAGFLLLPTLGAQRSLIAVSALALISGLLLLAAQPRTRMSSAFAVAGVLVFSLASVTTPDPAESAIARRYPGDQLLWREDGIQATVSIHRTLDGVQRMFLDGMSQAADDSATLGVHRIIGHLPMAIHPDPRQALVVGLGGGVTPGAVAEHAGVSVDVVELSETVVRGADWFSGVNSNVLRQPNVHFRIDDGRNYLLLTSKDYDVITADIIRPYTAGAGNLYSQEYFELAREALDDDGLMMQWVAGLPESQHKAIMRTFLNVFPNATLWSPTLLVGSKQPLELSRSAFERKATNPATREAMASIGVTDFDSLLKMYIAGPNEIRAYVGTGPLLTDDRPLVEYFLSLPPGEGKTDLARVRGDVRRHIVP